MMMLKHLLRGMLAVAMAATVALPAHALFTIQSTFDTNLDGWSTTGDATDPTWYAGDASSEGGYAQASDKGQSIYWYWSAPSKFLGNRGNAYGQNLRYRIWESDTGTPGDSGIPDIILKSADTTLVLAMPEFPVNTWVELSAALTETAGWKIDTLSGIPPTTEIMQGVLSNLQSIEIRGEYRSGQDTGRLSSVTLEMTGPPVATTMRTRR